MGCTQIVSYNGHEAEFHKLTYTSEHVYNDAATQVGTRYVFTVKGFITPDDDEESLRDAIVRLRTFWTPPRKGLVIKWISPSGKVEAVFDCAPPTVESADPDLEWGPTPIGLDIEDFVGGLAAKYTFRITAFVKDAYTSLGQKNQGYIAQNAISGLTRSFAFSISIDGFTTRTTSGRYSVVSNAVGKNAHGPSWFRDAVTPPLPDGFVRERCEFTMEPNQLTCAFTIVDKEVGSTPPDPITSGSAEISSRQDARGGKITFNLSGSFSAPKTVPKSTIIQKIDDLAKTYIGNSIVEPREFSASIYDKNAIRFHYVFWRIKIVPTGGTALFSSADKALVAKPPDSTGKAATSGVFGTAGLTEYLLTPPFDPTKTTLDQLRKVQSQRSKQAVVRTGSDLASLAESTATATVPDDSASDSATTPIIELTHARSYYLKANKVVLDCKQNGSASLVQQTASPRLMILDVGLMRYAAKTADSGPKNPDPPEGEVIGDPFVEVSVPTPIGDGAWNEYKVVWRYQVLVNRAIEGGTKAFEGLKVMVPGDQRRKAPKDEQFRKGPDSIVPVIPKGK